MKISNFTSCKIIWGVKEITNLRNLGIYILELLPLPLWVWPLPRPLDCTSPLGATLPLEVCLGLASAFRFLYLWPWYWGYLCIDLGGRWPPDWSFWNFLYDLPFWTFLLTPSPKSSSNRNLLLIKLLLDECFFIQRPCKKDCSKSLTLCFLARETSLWVWINRDDNSLALLKISSLHSCEFVINLTLNVQNVCNNAYSGGNILLNIHQLVSLVRLCSVTITSLFNFGTLRLGIFTGRANLSCNWVTFLGSSWLTRPLLIVSVNCAPNLGPSTTSQANEFATRSISDSTSIGSSPEC